MKYRLQHAPTLITETEKNIRSDCYSIYFRNQGDVSCSLYLGNFRIPAVMLPGDELSFGGNHPDIIIDTQFDLVFDTTTSGTNPSVLMIREILT